MNGHLKEFSKSSEPHFKGLVRTDWKGQIDAAKVLELLEAPDTIVLADGRHRISVISINGSQLAVKAFGRQKGWKDRMDFKRGSKASRSIEAAAFLLHSGVQTPPPIAYFDHWEGKTLVESFYITEYLEDLSSLHDELLHIFHHAPRCDSLVHLLEAIATSIRRMHDAGFIHRDLGNQNIQLQKREGQWIVQLIDLNRGRLKPSLSLPERANDLSRLFLPSMFLLYFARMYWQDQPPGKFLKYLDRAQSRFMLWHKTRGLRHPLRGAPPCPFSEYPSPPDLWLWDEQSAQASIMLSRRDRKRFYPRGRNLKMALSVLKNALPVRKNYLELQKITYFQKVDFTGRIGMALETTDLDFKKQRSHLDKLGKIPVLIRFCHHEGLAQWKQTIAEVQSLYRDGHEIMIALVQDRGAVLHLESWTSMCRLVFSELGDLVSMIELCHAVNRTKWGFFSPSEQATLLQPIVALKKEFPHVKVSGPACIDFEYYHVLNALEATPEDLHYNALSHHLYVDRRGSPENKQNGFSTIEKITLLRAIAQHSDKTAHKVIISEVNWPVKGTGIYSPVDATYMYPGQPESELNVSEEDYGYFMLRYLVLTICSGHVEKVYWWRLVAHGFGLVDERAEEEWRERPAFQMLQHFLSLLGNATFVEKRKTPENIFALQFKAAEKDIIMMWCNEMDSPPLPCAFKSVVDVFGNPLEQPEISDSPIYGII